MNNIGLLSQQQLQELQIKQVIEFYTLVSANLEHYKLEGYPLLEEQAEIHLQHWKSELKRLILGDL